MGNWPARDDLSCWQGLKTSTQTKQSIQCVGFAITHPRLTGMQNLHVCTAATGANWAIAQKFDYCIWSIKSTFVGVLDIFCKNWQRKVIFYSSKLHRLWLIRLRRYLGMQPQLTMHAICSFFLDVAQQKHRWATTQKTVLAKTNEVTPQAPLHSVIGTIVSFYVQRRCFYLSKQLGFWIDCILTERVNNVQNDTNRFCLDVAQYPWTHDQSHLIPPRVRQEFLKPVKRSKKPCRVCKKSSACRYSGGFSWGTPVSAPPNNWLT